MRRGMLPDQQAMVTGCLVVQPISETKKKTRTSKLLREDVYEEDVTGRSVLEVAGLIDDLDLCEDGAEYGPEYAAKLRKVLSAGRSAQTSGVPGV